MYLVERREYDNMSSSSLRKKDKNVAYIPCILCWNLRLSNVFSYSTNHLLKELLLCAVFGALQNGVNLVGSYLEKFGEIKYVLL